MLLLSSTIFSVGSINASGGNYSIGIFANGIDSFTTTLYLQNVTVNNVTVNQTTIAVNNGSSKNSALNFIYPYLIGLGAILILVYRQVANKTIMEGAKI
jgi:hypothetical protein